MQRKRLDPWPLEALQAMETHLGLNQNDQHQCAPLPAPCDMDMGPDLELECKVPLPHGWEQFLDLQTGQVYYIDWKSCRRSYTDPRRAFAQDVGKKGSRLFDSQSEITQSRSVHDDDARDDEATSKMQLENGAVDNNENGIVTYPMLQEDWDLMESRGWTASSAGDDHSEIGNNEPASDKTRIPPNTKSDENEEAAFEEPQMDRIDAQTQTVSAFRASSTEGQRQDLMWYELGQEFVMWHLCLDAVMAEMRLLVLRGMLMEERGSIRSVVHE